MIFYSVLFTFDPKKTEYVNCFWLLFQSLLRTGTFRTGDKYYLLADAASWEVAKKLPVIAQRVIHIPIPTPTNCFKGMAFKYMLSPELHSPEEVVVYLDVDLLSVRPFRPDLPPDSLGAFPEGPPEDSNYKGDFDLTLSAGASAGFFIYRSGPKTKSLFKRLVEELAASTKTFYTLDQPYFNKHIQGLAYYLPPWLLSFNGHTNQENCVFFNMCGEPGDGEFHFQKMLNVHLQLTQPPLQS